MSQTAVSTERLLQANESAADEVSSEAPTTVIRPGRPPLRDELREMWQYRELLGFLTWRDIKVRYKQTVIGGLWAILQPVVSMAIFSLVFGMLAKLDTDGVPYPIMVYAGLLPWTFLATSVTSAGNSLVSQANLLSKIYFPRLFVPTAYVGTAMVDFLLSFCVYVLLMVIYAWWPGVSVLLLPALMAVTILTALGMGYLLAGLTVTYRDFRYVIGFLVTAWMYASPVVYPASVVPAAWRPLAGLNPMYGVIAAFRSCLLNRPIEWAALGVSTASAGMLFALGVWAFRRVERRFADIA